ncbi:hypothetical protein S140_132 [Shewanella sp. phage 1/40]|uniref:hypothetical protein n=1 Tax=Shewanella phage 1/4 TaxID=1458859 RepID=UPI0004F8CFF7|nr:hypothetical protein S14_137 [Shewanella sp. phage 1/4]YP_009104130.1 hypothetical protein S140_132 [Shewanella sp. phage 1/40]AHK11246.1 hypothetical protein S14_137 [Shewanella sp. phage 1/4]AHK11539.1 hypothetical protein S140_132 [Shewanella sp. phage 1/40]
MPYISAVQCNTTFATNSNSSKSTSGGGEPPANLNWFTSLGIIRCNFIVPCDEEVIPCLA